MNTVARARIAALERAAKPDYDGAQATAAATQGLRNRFLREVDPNGTMPKEEREKKADRAMRAWMLRLAEKSAEARRKKAPTKQPKK